MRPLVSVIIPVYNTAPYLEKCIRSVLASSYTIIEILAIDDGSTDGSGMILDRLAKEDSRLHVEHRENQGVAAARNRGIEAAAGDYITFVDSDDYISKHYIRHAIACMQRTGALMAVCGLTYVSTEGKILNRLIPGEYTRFRHEEWPMRISAVAAHFYRRSMWIESGMRFISGARGEDMPVALYFSASCENIVTVKDGGYYYVQHRGSAMQHFRGLKQYNLPYDAYQIKYQLIRAINRNIIFDTIVNYLGCLARVIECDPLVEEVGFMVHLGKNVTINLVLSEETYKTLAKIEEESGIIKPPLNLDDSNFLMIADGPYISCGGFLLSTTINGDDEITEIVISDTPVGERESVEITEQEVETLIGVSLY